MQTNLNLEPELTHEQKYWRQVNALKGSGLTNTQDRAKLVLKTFIKAKQIIQKNNHV